MEEKHKVDHSQLLSRFDGKAFVKQLSQKSMEQAIVNYHRMKDPNSKLTVENFSSYFPSGAKLGLYQREIEGKEYRVDYDIDGRTFDFYLNDELYEQKSLLFLEKLDGLDENFIMQMQVKDFQMLHHLSIQNFCVDRLLEGVRVSEKEHYTTQDLNNLYYTMYYEYYGKRPYLEQDNDLDGIKNAYDFEPDHAQNFGRSSKQMSHEI